MREGGLREEWGPIPLRGAQSSRAGRMCLWWLHVGEGCKSTHDREGPGFKPKHSCWTKS